MENLEDSPTRKAHVTEKWWHRLLKVSLYGSTALVLVVIGMIQLGSARYYTYSYSFENAYENAIGNENDCTVYEYSKDVSCGDLRNSKQFVTQYLIANGEKRTKNGKLTIREAIALSKKEGHSDFDLSRYFIEDQKIRYKMQQHYNSKELISGFGYTLIVGGIWFIVGLIGYKILLYIVHGHTQVKREPRPGS